MKSSKISHGHVQLYILTLCTYSINRTATTAHNIGLHICLGFAAKAHRLAPGAVGARPSAAAMRPRLARPSGAEPAHSALQGAPFFYG